FRKHALLRATANVARLLRAEFFEVCGYVCGGLRLEDFLLRGEKRLQAGPGVADDCGSATCRLKQANRGRVSRLDHVFPGQVQSELRRGIKRRMELRFEVNDLLNISGPGDGGRILWPGHDEALLRELPRRLAEQFLEFGLAVGGI